MTIKLSALDPGNAFRLLDSAGIGYKVVGKVPVGTVPIVKAVTHYYMTPEIQCVPIALISTYDMTQAQKFVDDLADDNQILLSAAQAGSVVQIEGIDDYTALVTALVDSDGNILVVALGFAKNEDEDLDVVDLGIAQEYNINEDERPTAGDVMDLLTEHLGT